MKYIVFLLLITSSFLACNHLTHTEQIKELRWLGDIEFDPKLDNPDFEICNGEENIHQYFNIGNNIKFEGNKPYINQIFKEKYKTDIVKKESGLVRIRFIVNCHGETDRFRVLTSTLSYKEMIMDKNITNQLLEITKSLKGWKPKKDEGKLIEYYQYLVFKIVDGNLTKILP